MIRLPVVLNSRAIFLGSNKFFFIPIQTTTWRRTLCSDYWQREQEQGRQENM